MELIIFIIILVAGSAFLIWDLCGFPGRKRDRYKPDYPVIEHRNKNLASFIRDNDFKKIYISTWQERVRDDGLVTLSESLGLAGNCLSLEEIFELFADWQTIDRRV